MTRVQRYIPKNFEVPQEGVYWAELAEIKDLGEVDTPDGKREKVRFAYELDETDSQGGKLLVFQTFNRSLHPQSRLSEAIYDLTGKEPDPNEDYELDDLHPLPISSQALPVRSQQKNLRQRRCHSAAQDGTRRSREEAGRCRHCQG